MREQAILITLQFDSMKQESSLEDLSKEFEQLSLSAGVAVVKNLIVRQKFPKATFLVGRGKVDELKKLREESHANVVIFDRNLSASQQRNLEEAVGAKVIDRTQLILDIFAQRAKSAEGRLQVELAQLKYLLPRLTGKGILLSRLGGGVGTRGPGEQKLEVDRRRIREKIAKLSRELEELKNRRLSGIEKKRRNGLPIVALVGYTNAGKSTLFNVLTQSAVAVRHQLFSTLDTTTRLLTLPGNQKVLLVDTVGFIRDLPHHLIESFKATLEEAIHADLVLHVIDASRSDQELLQKAVQQVLFGLGLDEGKAMRILNKIDLLDAPRREYFTHHAEQARSFLVSSKTQEGLADLRRSILEKIQE